MIRYCSSTSVLVSGGPKSTQVAPVVGLFPIKLMLKGKVSLECDGVIIVFSTLSMYYKHMGVHYPMISNSNSNNRTTKISLKTYNNFIDVQPVHPLTLTLQTRKHPPPQPIRIQTPATPQQYPPYNTALK